jgi:FlaA1/EpsC-like NDP-sugar epimerase
MMRKPPLMLALVVTGPNVAGWIGVNDTIRLVVFISTDKAIEPTGVTGATKSLAERLPLSTPSNQTLFFTAVSFGNVPNSRVSVVSLFLKQIDQDGPVTITNKDMFRFLMGFSEAVSLIIQATAYTHGWDAFIYESVH